MKLMGKVEDIAPGERIYSVREDYLRAEQYYWPGDGKNAERLLYISKNLYTLSQKVWQVNDLHSLSERKILLIP
jgi:uncharacterized secreted protein with C-terminal beta-propeller domain